MALQMTFTYGGLTIEGGYLKLTNVMIDNNKKTCSGELVFYSKKGENQAFPVSLPRSFSGVTLKEKEDPREVLYNHIVSQLDYAHATMV